MAAVADLLDNIVQQVEVGEQSSGLEVILAYGEAISAQIMLNPAYAQAMARALFQAEAGSPIVDVLLQSNQRFLQRELRHAQRRQELQPTVQPAAAASMLMAHIWGVLLVWNKGLLSLSSLPTMSRQSMVASLTGLASERGQALLRKYEIPKQ